MKVVISLGGSLLTRLPGTEGYLRYADAAKRLAASGHRLVVVCGGGKTSRGYQEVARELGADRSLLDRIGVLGTHVNALLLMAALGDSADRRIFVRAGEVRRSFGGKILIGGGYLPGSSTDYRAALFAKAISADMIVNATDYGGVFDKDPSKYKDARQFSTLSYDEFERIVRSRFVQEPGNYGLFDLKATRLVRKHRITTVIVDGGDPEEIVRAVEGSHHGTLIC